MASTDYPTYNINSTPKSLEFRIEEIAFNNHYNVNAQHAHDYFEIFLFESGGGFHTIDFNRVEIEPQSIHLVLPGQIHQIGREGSCTGLVVLFSKDYLSSNHNLSNTIKNYPFINKQENPYIKTIPRKIFSSLFEILKQFFNGNDLSGFNSKEIIQSYLNILLLKTQEIFLENKIQISPIVQQLISFLDNSCTNTTTPQSLCANLHTSSNSLNALTLKELGKSASLLIKEALIMAVKKELLLSNSSVKEIAYQFDFSDPSNFNKFFKRETGLTPIEFKKHKK